MYKQAALWVLVGIALCIAACFAWGHFGSNQSGGTATMGHFESKHVGLKFDFPDSYDQELKHIEERGVEYHVVVLLPKSYMSPEGGEGPPSITIASYSNAEGLPLEQFIQNEPKTNFALSPDKKLTPTTVGGEQALAYRYSGLYEFDAVAVKHGTQVFVFAAGWQGSHEQIRADFQDIITNVSFIDYAH